MPVDLFNVYLYQDGFEPPPKEDEPIYFLLARDGMYQVTRTDFYTAMTPAESLGWLDKLQPSIKLTLPQKIPAMLLATALDFFRKVYEKFQSEAICLLYWDGKDYHLKAPRQLVVGDFKVYHEIGPNPPGMTRIGSVHSHGSFHAMPSGTDRYDEEHDDGLHFIVGGLDWILTIFCSVVVNGNRFSFSPEAFFEISSPKELKSAKAPDEWLDRVVPYNKKKHGSDPELFFKK